MTNFPSPILIAILEFKPFTAVIPQKDKVPTFSEFKVALRSLKRRKK